MKSNTLPVLCVEVIGTRILGYRILGTRDLGVNVEYVSIGATVDASLALPLLCHSTHTACLPIVSMFPFA